MTDKFYQLAMRHDANINATKGLPRDYSACLHCGYRGLPSVTTEDRAVLVPCPACTLPRCQDCTEHYQEVCPIR